MIFILLRKCEISIMFWLQQKPNIQSVYMRNANNHHIKFHVPSWMRSYRWSILCWIKCGRLFKVFIAMIHKHACVRVCWAFHNFPIWFPYNVFLCFAKWFIIINSLEFSIQLEFIFDHVSHSTFTQILLGS